jgi:hypothetical protein
MKKDKKLQKKFTPHHHRHFSRVLVLPNLTFFENIILGLLYGLRLLPFLGRLRPGGP